MGFWDLYSLPKCPAYCWGRARPKLQFVWHEWRIPQPSPHQKITLKDPTHQQSHQPQQNAVSSRTHTRMHPMTPSHSTKKRLRTHLNVQSVAHAFHEPAQSNGVLEALQGNSSHRLLFAKFLRSPGLQSQAHDSALLTPSPGP